jgi:hypothetical protein
MAALQENFRKYVEKTKKIIKKRKKTYGKIHKNPL